MDEQLVGQYVAYTYFKVDPAWRRLPAGERAAHKHAWVEVLKEHSPRYEWLHENGKSLRLAKALGVELHQLLMPIED